MSCNFKIHTKNIGLYWVIRLTFPTREVEKERKGRKGGREGDRKKEREKGREGRKEGKKKETNYIV